MTVIYWPSTLPDRHFLGMTYAPKPQFIETAMDHPIPKRRRRWSAKIVELDLPMVFLTGAEMAIFETFYETTLAGGTLSFVWKDELRRTNVTMNFREPPPWTPFAAIQPSQPCWRAPFKLRLVL
jgi:hypothetical protein